MSIPELAARSKYALDRIPRSVLLVSAIVLTASAAFGLGVLEGRGSEVAGISVTQLATATPGFMQAASPGLAPAAAQNTASTTLPAGGEVVASKTGTKYYLPWCGTVKLIKDENKVWFATREAAEAAGYQPASNCKGL